MAEKGNPPFVMKPQRMGHPNRVAPNEVACPQTVFARKWRKVAAASTISGRIRIPIELLAADGASH